MKKIFFFCLIILSVRSSWSQTGKEIFFMEYKVQPKDNFYSIGRMFNASPKVIAAYNKLEMSKGLMANKIIRIPVDDSAIAAVDNKTKTVYYIISKGDNLTKVSRKCHTPEKNLMEWNHLQGDKILLDQKMVVGFLKYKIPSSQEPAQTIPAKKDEDSLAVADNKNPNIVIEKIDVETKETVQDPAPVKIKEEPQKIKEKTDDRKTVKTTETVTPLTDGGYFTSYFKKQVVTQPVSTNSTVTAGVFKTTSGWQDQKYYVLIDKVSPATIIQVVNPSNNKAIYAKVLGPVNGIRQNEGYDIRICDAAAKALEISDESKFIVKIIY
jgi:LysM repeat protein